MCASKNMSSTPRPKARNGKICNRKHYYVKLIDTTARLTWVEAALNLIPMNEQNPNPDETATVTSRTPANPNAP